MYETRHLRANDSNGNHQKQLKENISKVHSQRAGGSLQWILCHQQCKGCKHYCKCSCDWVCVHEFGKIVLIVKEKKILSDTKNMKLQIYT